MLLYIIPFLLLFLMRSDLSESWLSAFACVRISLVFTSAFLAGHRTATLHTLIWNGSKHLEITDRKLGVG